MNNDKSVSEQFPSVNNLVENIFENHIEARNSHRELLYWYIKSLGGTSLEDLRSIPFSVMSIMRAAQKIQNTDGKWKPSEDVLEMRKKRSQEFKQYMKKLKEAN